MLTVSCLDANMTSGWQQMKNEQSVTKNRTEKQIYETFEWKWLHQSLKM